MKNKTLFSALVFSLIFVGSLSAQWTKTKGLPGGSFGHFAQIADTTFAQHDAGIYFSTDSGFTWQNLLTYQFYWSARLTNDGHNLLVRRYFVDPLMRLMRSNDAGQSWITIPVPDTLSISSEVIVGQWVVIATPDGAFRTSDNGATWEFVHNFLGDLRLDGQRIFGWDADSLMASSDFGQSWQGLASVSNVSTIFAKDSLIMVFQYQNKNILSVSKDNGLSWEVLFPILPSGIRFNQMFSSIWHNGEVYGIWGTEIFKTSDFGETWVETTPPYLDVVTNGISIGEGLLAGGGAGGIFRSNDGGDSWSAVNDGLTSQSPNRLRSYGSHLFAPGREGIYRLATDQENWELQKVEISLATTFHSFSDYAELNGNQVVSISYKPWFSVDGGTTWAESMVESFTFFTGIDRLEIASGNLIGLQDVGSTGDRYVSDDFGQTFQAMDALQTQYGTYMLRLYNDKGTLYAQTGDHRLFLSSDGGAQWNTVGTDIPIHWFGGNPQWFDGGLFFVRGGSVFVFSNDTDYSQFGTKLLFSKDLGQTWQLFDNLTTGFPWGIGIFNDLVESGGYLIAATKDGVFYSSDTGTTWTAWNDGFQNRVASRLCVHDGYLWASMTSDGVWKRTLADLAPLSVVQPQTPMTLNIFPNPASDHFWVETNDESGWLTVRETLGRTVFSGKTTGHPMEIICKEWPEGIYHLSFFGETSRRESYMVIQK
ncbi:MAG: hypothetical protein H7246_15375 [Phycisphaerae bacterium]|nr:hypothetical protein [Saprospiraceae bacterium]